MKIPFLVEDVIIDKSNDTLYVVTDVFEDYFFAYSEFGGYLSASSFDNFELYYRE